MKRRNKDTQRKEQRGRLLRLKKETVRRLTDETLTDVNGGGSCYNPPEEM